MKKLLKFYLIINFFLIIWLTFFILIKINSPEFIESNKQNLQNYNSENNFFDNSNSYDFKYRPDKESLNNAMNRYRIDQDKKIKLLEKQNDADSYSELGDIYYGMGNYPKAIYSYLKVLELRPKSYEAYGEIGGAYNNLKDYDQAIINFNKALKINPYYVDSYMGLATSYWNKGDEESALINCKKGYEVADEKEKEFILNDTLIYSVCNELLKSH